MNNQDDHVNERLARIERLLNELLRRIPEPRCRLCGQIESWHPSPQQAQINAGTQPAHPLQQSQALASHFFTP